MASLGTTQGEAADFANDPIGADGLPQLHEESFEPLDPAYVRVRALAAVAAAAVIAVTTATATLLISSWVPLAIGAVGLAVVAVVGFVQRVETDHMGFLIREHDVSFSSGVISRSVATAPFARVQHVSIDRGPIDRRFGLAALQLRTAGGQISIPGLNHDAAERLKQLVTDRAGALADTEIDAEIDAETDRGTDAAGEFEADRGDAGTDDDAA